MSSSKPTPLRIHGSAVFAHPLFLAQLEVRARQVEAFQQKDPIGYVNKNATKRLATITSIGFGRTSSSSTVCSSATTLRAR